MSKLVDNEVIKIRATFWNNLAVTAMAAGVVIPSVTSNSG